MRMSLVSLKGEKVDSAQQECKNLEKENLKQLDEIAVDVQSYDCSQVTKAKIIVAIDEIQNLIESTLYS